LAADKVLHEHPTDPPEDLPEWPSRGDRRRVEERWLQSLERWGLHAFLPEPPAAAPAGIHRAIEQFNAGEFWECHETLEAVWLETPYPLRLFYHALIKAAAGFYHAKRHNRHGARVKLADSVRVLAVFPGRHMGVDAALLREELSGWLSNVDGPASVDWTAVDALPRPRIRAAA
jgi:hypothetical protein